VRTALRQAALGDESARAEREAIQSEPTRFYWRVVLPTWPVELRERWGRRANQLAESGVAWPDDERTAYEEIASCI
jgi:hypothetical protein